MDNYKEKIFIILLSSIIATTTLSNNSIKVGNRKASLYNTLINNKYLSNDEVDNLYSLLVDEFNYGRIKIINNKLNYIYYKLNKTYSDYDDYLDCLTGEYLLLPDDNNMVFQGIACYEDNIIISAYNENRVFKSCLYVINKDNNNIKKVMLDNSSHVGGIAYDDVNKLLWVTVKDKLYGYDINDVLFKNEINKRYETILLSDIGNYSFLTYRDNRLYIGNYRFNSNSVIKVYKLSKSNINSNINFIPEGILEIPSKVQGVDFITVDKEVYLLLSRSCYIFYDSEILIYRYDKNNNNYIDNYISKINCPPMLEEILVEDDKILTLYESGSSKYSDCLTNINHIYYSNIKRKIRKK